MPKSGQKSEVYDTALLHDYHRIRAPNHDPRLMRPRPPRNMPLSTWAYACHAASTHVATPCTHCCWRSGKCMTWHGLWCRRQADGGQSEGGGRGYRPVRAKAIEPIRPHTHMSSRSRSRNPSCHPQTGLLAPPTEELIGVKGSATPAAGQITQYVNNPSPV